MNEVTKSRPPVGFELLAACPAAKLQVAVRNVASSTVTRSFIRTIFLLQNYELTSTKLCALDMIECYNRFTVVTVSHRWYKAQSQITPRHKETYQALGKDRLQVGKTSQETAGRAGSRREKI